MPFSVNSGSDTAMVIWIYEGDMLLMEQQMKMARKERQNSHKKNPWFVLVFSINLPFPVRPFRNSIHAYECIQHLLYLVIIFLQNGQEFY